jgi:predicted HTH transcriptional regulator
MNKKKVLSIIERGEGIKVDFKQELYLDYESCKREFAKDVCAIANSPGGRGYIVVGVEDKSKKILGVEESKLISEEKIQQIISTRCEPPIPITVDNIEVDEKKLIIITIYDGGQKPYQIRESGAFYIRRGSTNDVMRKGELVAAFEESLNLIVETCPLMNTSIEFLNIDLVSKYFRNKGIYINKENENFLLESSGITYLDKVSKSMKCTLGGLLIFSDNNSVCIPYNMVKIVNRINDKKDNVITIQGNLLDIIDKVQVNLKEILPSNYPTYAVMEGVKNAVLYREYSMVDRVIEVIITKRNIIIISPGQLILNNNGAYQNRYRKRNLWIYDKLITLDDNNRFINDGKGIERVRGAFRDRGNVKFINSTLENCFKVILPIY